MTRRTWPVVALVIGVTLLVVGPALAQPSPPAQPPRGPWDHLSGALLQLLAVVLLLESALSAVFQWRVYRMVFNARAWKTPIMLLTGLLLVLTTGYNPMDVILRAVAGTGDTGGDARVVFTTLLSALIVAGGSSGIYALFRKLGIRAPEEERDTSKLRDDQAYLSVRIVGAPYGVPVYIGIDEADQAASDIKDGFFFDRKEGPPLAGSIDPRGLWARIVGAFMADASRFPNYGGRVVRTDKHYAIIATWRDPQAAAASPALTRGIFRGRFAPRAFIDMEVDLGRP